MKTSSAKAKGKRCAQEVKELLVSGAPVLDGDDIVVTPSGVPGVDLHLSPAAKTFYPFAIECKCQESIAIWQALKQAESHPFGDEIPILFFKRNRSKLYVCLEAEQFIKLIRQEKTAPPEMKDQNC